MVSKVVDQDHYFFTSDGRTLTSKLDMLSFLKETSDQVFFSHVNAEKNDFASWTADILKDKKLSKKMRSCHSRDEMVRVVQEMVKVKKGGSDKQSVIAQLVSAIKHG